MTSTVKLFNTRTRSKETLDSQGKDALGLYACGPTVYHYAHIGNLRTYVFEDLLVRTLKRAGFSVNHVMNITDVGHLVSDGDDGEDKMEKGARREGKTAWEIAEFYEQAFWRDFDALQCVRPSKTPKATAHIQEMIALIQKLEKNGLTYETKDGVYYDTSQFSTYADFARLDADNLKAGARVAVGEKRNPTDFALWKFSPQGEQRQMEWDSPWGKGFPGWHIECSAMAMKYLGDHFDIHCGGKDHIPVHHTNEIAQSEGATGETFVDIWLHGEFLTEKSGKMSKSADEFLTLSVLEKRGFLPEHYRFLLLQAHYRTELQFDWESMEAAKSGFDGLLNRLGTWDQRPLDLSQVHLTDATKAYRERFNAALFDDLNTPIALSVLFEVIKNDDLSADERYWLVEDFDSILGLRILDLVEERKNFGLTPEVKELVAKRDEARRQKDWQGSDEIRDELQKMGYRVEDTAQGTRVVPK